MCQKKAVVVSLSIFLLVAASFCIYQAQTENKVGHHSEIKSESPCNKQYKKYCLNGGESYYLVDEDIVACNCTGLYGGKRCEKNLWRTQIKCSSLKSDACIFFNSKSDALYFFNSKLDT